MRAYAREFSATRREFTFFVNELYDGQVVFFTHLIVVFTERGRDMNNARTVGKRNVRITRYKMRFFAVIENFFAKRIQRFVLFVDRS